MARLNHLTSTYPGDNFHTVLRKHVRYLCTRTGFGIATRAEAYLISKNQNKLSSYVFRKGKRKWIFQKICNKSTKEIRSHINLKKIFKIFSCVKCLQYPHFETSLVKSQEFNAQTMECAIISYSCAEVVYLKWKNRR